MNALVKRLTEANYAYHNGLSPLMTDDEYDAAIDQLRVMDPTHPFLTKVGAPVAAGDEVALPIPLPSLNKIKPDGTLQKWLAKFPATHYHASIKLDGCSALWFPATGKLYTRGDGLKGRDISAFVRYFQGLSTKGSAIAVRGELIMRTDSAAIPAGKLARNIVAGALNRKAAEVDPTLAASNGSLTRQTTGVDPTLFREIRFVAYELVEPATLTPTAAYQYLAANGYEVAASTKIPVSEMTEASLSKIFSDMEAASPYQLDGIVIAPNQARAPSFAHEVRTSGAVNPADRVAWKSRLTATTTRTTVRSVEWNVSASGVLIPRVLFDSVTLAGANISAATGLHGRWIFDNAVGPGAVIEVRRAGDVIPQIIAVHTVAPGGAAMPANYTWDSVHIRPVGDDAATESAQIRLTRGLAELGAENVGPGMVAKLHAAGFDTIGKIYVATQADFAARVASCGPKMAEKIWTGLRAAQPSWTELHLMCASCAMPRGVGATKLTPLLALNPTPATWSAAAFQAARPAGLSDATIEAIVDAIPAYLAWRSETKLTPAIATTVATTAPPSGYIIVFTGSRDKALEAELAAKGHSVADAISKKTTHVVYPDGPTPTSSKIVKAQEIGAKLLSASEARATLL
jgi:NAD-dependent DNA ligase